MGMVSVEDENARAQRTREQSDPNALNTFERGFLGALQVAEKMGVGGTALKLYNDVIQRGRTSTITENDLTDEEKKSFYDLVKARAEDSGQKTGTIDYKHYLQYKVPPGNWGITNILGGFKYSMEDDGRVKINDTYDFNADRAAIGENNPLVQDTESVMLPVGLAASIGRKIKPDTGGKGVPVDISLEAPK
jgi:hypothetical protein